MIYLFAVIIIGCTSIAGYFKAKADLVMKSEEFLVDWKNKYKEPFEPIPKGIYGWYHRFVGAKYKERYLFSASFFVNKTDRWHKYNTYRHFAYHLITLVGCIGLFPIHIALAVAGTAVIMFYLIFNIAYGDNNIFNKTSNTKGEGREE